MERLFWIPLVAVGIYAQVKIWWPISEVAWQRAFWQVLGFAIWIVFCVAAVAFLQIAYSDPKFNNFSFQVESGRLFDSYNEELDSSLDLKNLWILNQRRLDLYHRIATSQSRSSFRNAQIAASVGFLVLVISVVLVWFSDNTATAVTSGAVGAFAGALGAYLGRTFVKSQEGASAQLREYFNHPLELSKILVVERLIERLPDGERTAVIQVIANSLLGFQQSAGSSPSSETSSNG